MGPTLRGIATQMCIRDRRKPNGKGSWMVYKDTDLEYCEQVTAEHKVCLLYTSGRKHRPRTAAAWQNADQHRGGQVARQRPLPVSYTHVDGNYNQRFGYVDGDLACIFPSLLREALENAGFSYRKTCLLYTSRCV